MNQKFKIKLVYNKARRVIISRIKLNKLDKMIKSLIIIFKMCLKE